MYTGAYARIPHRLYGHIHLFIDSQAQVNMLVPLLTAFVSLLYLALCVVAWIMDKNELRRVRRFILLPLYIVLLYYTFRQSFGLRCTIPEVKKYLQEPEMEYLGQESNSLSQWGTSEAFFRGKHTQLKDGSSLNWSHLLLGTLTFSQLSPKWRVPEETELGIRKSSSGAPKGVAGTAH